jgi:hypothetical protein
MIEIDGKIIGLDVFDKKFVCDLTACKGACCIEGDAGAPLTLEEVDILEEIYEDVKPYMRQEGIDEVEKNGVFYMDVDNEPVTALVNGKECAFVNFDENGIAKCAIDNAHREGKVSWKKPISCHLYPIRVSKLSVGLALNYHEWPICKPACECGSRLDVPVYKFLKEPLIREFGEEFYGQLETAAEHLKKD